MKIKERIELRRKKRKEYWDNLDVDRELKIEKIKRSRDFRDVLGGCGFFLFLLCIFIPVLLMAACNLLTALTSKYYDVDNQKRILNELCIEDVNVSYAAYEDVVNNTDSIVYINQHVNNTYVHNYTLSNGTTILSSDDIFQGHKYYVKFIVPSDNSIIYQLRFINDDYEQFFGRNITNSFDNIVTADRDYLKFTVYPFSSGLVIDSCWLIDLSQMYGIGNEPDITQARNIFVFDYLYYDVGTPISISGLDSYSQGYSAAINQQPIYYSGNIFNNNFNMQIVDRNNSFVTSNYIEIAPSTYEGYSMCYFSIPSPLLYGDSCTFMSLSDRFEVGFIFTSIQDVSTLNPTIEICYLNEGYQVLTTISKSNGLTYDTYIDEGLGVYTYYYYFDGVSFDIPMTISNLYFRSSYYYEILRPQLVVYSNNVTFEIQQSFDNGYKKAEDKYTAILDQYASGGDKYNQILNYGKQLGREEAHTYTFGYLMTSVVEAPLNAILNLFNFDFLGYNMKDFVTLLLTMSVIIVVIRLFMGGKS